jgi:hypothetical protein
LESIYYAFSERVVLGFDWLLIVRLGWFGFFENLVVELNIVLMNHTVGLIVMGQYTLNEGILNSLLLIQINNFLIFFPDLVKAVNNMLHLH